VIRNRVFANRSMTGFRAFGWQADIRFDSWLPLSVRERRNKGGFEYVLRVPLLGWHVTLGRLTRIGAS
jgi:hypothetical protein